MATYKVIQDIEAEDKLVGPLSLRQFIYGGIAGVCVYLSVVALARHLAFLLAVLAPIALFTGFFAFPWGRDQPTEVWALAKIRFFLKPRRRIWDQSGVKELVNITAPKQVIRSYAKSLSQTEVQSRLTALASTIDSRGWAIKGAGSNAYSAVPESDRLVGPTSLPQEVNSVDIQPSEDILDAQHNPVAQKLDQLVTASSSTHRQRIIEQLQAPIEPTGAAAGGGQLPPPADYWFLNQPLEPPKLSGNNTIFSAQKVVPPGSTNDTGVPATEPTAEEEALAEKLREQRERGMQAVNYQHMKVIQPLGMAVSHPPVATPQPPPPAPVTPAPDPAKMVLVNNNDLNVATIQRLANKEDTQPNEVVISLHDHSS